MQQQQQQNHVNPSATRTLTAQHTISKGKLLLLHKQNISIQRSWPNFKSGLVLVLGVTGKFYELCHQSTARFKPYLQTML